MGIAQDGTLLKQLDTQNGFPDDSQNYLKRSEFGGLWIGLNNEGAVYMDSDLVLLKYSKKQGITGYINDIKVIDRKLYVATGAGLFVSSKTSKLFGDRDYIYSDTREEQDFQQIGDLAMIWSIIEYDDFIFLATEEGVRFSKKAENQSYDGLCDIPNEIEQPLPVQAFTFYITFDSKYFLVGLEDGVGIISLGTDKSGGAMPKSCVWKV